VIGGSAGIGLEMRPGGTLLLRGGTGGRRVGHGLGIASAATAALTGVTYDTDGGQQFVSS
jgi:hypothetical protein